MHPSAATRKFGGEFEPRRLRGNLPGSGETSRDFSCQIHDTMMMMMISLVRRHKLIGSEGSNPSLTVSLGKWGKTDGMHNIFA